MAGKKILLVDDEEELLMAMKIRLNSWGYDVATATNGEEALNILKKDTPDIVVLDIMMPVMDGIETLRRIRKINKTLPVLMLTAYTSEEKIKTTEKFGMSGFVQKGGDLTDVSQAIRVILDGIKNTEKK